MLEKSKDKIQQICDMLKQETLQPAEKEAHAIIERANIEAKAIIESAQKEADALLKQAKEDMKRDEAVFSCALQEASKLSVERLKQDIIDNLFNTQLDKLVEISMANPLAIANLIDAVIIAITKEGTSADISALIPAKIDPKEINLLLKKDVLDHLKDKSVAIDSFKGGAKIRLNDKKFTIEITDEFIVSLLENHLRKDFRKWLFKSNT
jgi:V/A-type H+-transporting ATPase subunit E